MSKPVALPYETLMAYLDGELSEEKRAEFERLLKEHPEWQTEVEQYAAIVSGTGHLRVKPPDPHLWDNYWEEIDARLQKRVGWVLLLVGGLALLGYGVWKVITFAENDYVRAGIAIALIGVLLLFAAVLRGRFSELGKDRYRRIRR